MTSSNEDHTLATLVTASSENEAGIIKDLLESAGISVFVHTHGTMEVFPFSVGEQSLADVLVNANQLTEAQNILSSSASVTDEELSSEAMNEKIII